ncbi:hypothetical protein JAAARDRAFT_63522 [Jaapia argillacea MUCL 33604]|uniref:CigA protein n=1 Tax=Jaapia argillacea MUCL 33604 TaxID=933084 RepID=A0A067PGZ9_9AGAM|nr:hypothetical protein JAAARDRAFT_63522 [Jaapia argillacea MUCL 33604]
MARQSLSLQNPRYAQSSPSVTLEKGAYRLRAPARSRSSSRLTQSSVTNSHEGRAHASFSRILRTLSTYEGQVALLLALLAGATVSCFGAAYWLYTTRWASVVNPTPQPAISDDIHSISRQVTAIEHSEPIPAWNSSSHQPKPPQDPHVKYLTYLPHSGFHNQRISFQNALFLAHILNRTLIVPPIRLGSRPIRYTSFDKLYRFVSLSGKEGLEHCARLGRGGGNGGMWIPTECEEYDEWTNIPWDWLVDLLEIDVEQRLLHRWDMTPSFFSETLNISPQQTFYLKDSSPYQYQFTDRPPSNPHTRSKKQRIRYTESISLASFSFNTSSSRLVHLGTLFGTSRLRLKDPLLLQKRKEIEQTMIFRNPVLVKAAHEIRDILSGRHPYLGAHIRISDGIFKAKAHETVRLVWWKLVHHSLGFSVDFTLNLERAFSGNTTLKPPASSQLLSSTTNSSSLFSPATIPDRSLPLSPALNIPRSTNHPRCRTPLHTRPERLALNTPLFISIDVSNPHSEPLIDLFTKTFPCIWFLHDFDEDGFAFPSSSPSSPASPPLSVLNALRNPMDSLYLKPFLLPFVDALVASEARHFVGTEGSTFSGFVRDVLWKGHSV